MKSTKKKPLGGGLPRIPGQVNLDDRKYHVKNKYVVLLLRKYLSDVCRPLTPGSLAAKKRSPRYLHSILADRSLPSYSYTFCSDQRKVLFLFECRYDEHHPEEVKGQLFVGEGSDSMRIFVMLSDDPEMSLKLRLSLSLIRDAILFEIPDHQFSK